MGGFIRLEQLRTVIAPDTKIKIFKKDVWAKSYGCGTSYVYQSEHGIEHFDPESFVNNIKVQPDGSVEIYIY